MNEKCIWDDRVVQDAQDTKEKKADVSSLLNVFSEMKNSPKSQILTDCLRVAIYEAIEKDEVDVALMVALFRRQLMPQTPAEIIPWQPFPDSKYLWERKGVQDAPKEASNG